MKIPYIPYIVIRSDNMFIIGDGIFYPKYSAGIVINIEDKEIYGITKKYYIIKLIANGMLTMIPVDFEETKRLRRVIGKNDYQKVIDILNAEKKTMPVKWGDRYRLYNNSINEGNIFQLCEIVRDIYFMKSQKDISKSDIKMFDEILSMVASELCIVMEVEFEKMKEAIIEILKANL